MLLCAACCVFAQRNQTTRPCGSPSLCLLNLCWCCLLAVLQGMTSMVRAAQKNHEGIEEMLMHRGGTLHSSSTLGWSIFHKQRQRWRERERKREKERERERETHTHTNHTHTHTLSHTHTFSLFSLEARKLQAMYDADKDSQSGSEVRAVGLGLSLYCLCLLFRLGLS